MAQLLAQSERKWWFNPPSPSLPLSIDTKPTSVPKPPAVKSSNSLSCVCVCVCVITKTSVALMITLGSFNLFWIFCQRSFLERYRNSTPTHILLQNVKSQGQSFRINLMFTSNNTNQKKSIGPGWIINNQAPTVSHLPNYIFMIK